MKLSNGGKYFIAALALAMIAAPCVAENAIRINLGTLAPRGSTYHQSLQAMAEKWKQAPRGGARLVIYPDGTQGGEADMVRLMRVGTLHAAECCSSPTSRRSRRSCRGCSGSHQARAGLLKSILPEVLSINTPPGGPVNLAPLNRNLEL